MIRESIAANMGGILIGLFVLALLGILFGGLFWLAAQPEATIHAICVNQ